MEFALNLAVVLSVVTVIPAAIASIAAENAVFAYVRLNHPQIFEQLSRPTIWSRRLNASSPGVRFISGRGYQEIQDLRLSHLGNRARKLQLVAVSVFLALVLSILLSSALG